MVETLTGTGSDIKRKLMSSADGKLAEHFGGASPGALIDDVGIQHPPQANARWDKRTYTARTIRLTDWVAEIIPAARRIQSLPVGWDGCGGPPPSPDLVRQALETLQLAEMETLPAPNVVPVPGGGVQFEWYLAERELEVEFKPSGIAEFLKTVVASDEDSEGSFQAGDYHALRELLGWLDSGDGA